MRDLFSMDLADYNPDWKVYKRPSARAIIRKEDKILLVYSLKYDYYTFPGGGIHSDESPAKALQREVLEETGYHVLPESIREYGRVLRRQKDTVTEDCIFEQENLYYFCEITDEISPVSLDDYEKEEGFTPVFVEPAKAARLNHYRDTAGGDKILIEREEKVLTLLSRELPKLDRAARETAAIRGLGNPDYEGMLAFVESVLSGSPTEQNTSGEDFPYSRFDHTRRVLAWAKRLYDLSEHKEALRYEDVMIATIFHDVGRNIAITKKIQHAEAGMPITREYLLSHGFDADRTEYICSLVGAHSDKHRMTEPGLDPNLLLLMEADAMDDMGALGIVMDCMIVEHRDPHARFADSLDHITRYTLRMQQDNPMVTAPARRIWDEKTALTEAFVKSLQQDIEFIY